MDHTTQHPHIITTRMHKHQAHNPRFAVSKEHLLHRSDSRGRKDRDSWGGGVCSRCLGLHWRCIAPALKAAWPYASAARTAAPDVKLDTYLRGLLTEGNKQ